MLISLNFSTGRLRLECFPFVFLVVTSAGLSEDSDYTSEVNYPMAQHQANGSASQYLSVAGQYPSPQRSTEMSRENSYETNDTSTDQRHWTYDYAGAGGAGGGPYSQVSRSVCSVSPIKSAFRKLLSCRLTLSALISLRVVWRVRAQRQI